MLAIRKAQATDRPAIAGIIKQLDLAYPAQTFNNFWVAEDCGKIFGVVELREFSGFFFLSSLGVEEKHQHLGIAADLLASMLAGLKKDVYLYTTIPDFFSRFGFQIIADQPKGLPPREKFSCRECTPETCVCMRRQAT